ncbi:unnamed protein product, partial [Linum tenue]
VGSRGLCCLLRFRASLLLSLILKPGFLTLQIPRVSCPCRVLWKQEANSKFSVKSLYTELVGSHSREIEEFPAKIVWIPWIPSKICFFTWLVYHNRVLSLDNLKRRGLYLANRCVLCKKDEESVQHLLVDCDFVRRIWILMYGRRSRTPSLNGAIAHVLANWVSADGDGIEKWFDVCILHSVWWAVWLERNQRTFEDKDTCLLVVGKRAARKAIEWIVVQGKTQKAEGRRWLVEKGLV